MACEGPTVRFINPNRTVECSALGIETYRGELPDGGWKSGKRVFVTSRQYAGGEILKEGGQGTGLASADALCSQVAVVSHVPQKVARTRSSGPGGRRYSSCSGASS
jgi:hypothetical protein